MGISTLLSATVYYMVKYVVYGAVILGAVALGKVWADHSKKPAKETE